MADIKIYGKLVNATESGKIANYSQIDGTPDITEVEANPTGDGTVTLNKLKVGETIYNVPQGGGGSSGDFDPTKYYTKTETDGLLNGKQDDLNQTQLNAVNSGITATKVSTYDGYATSISNKVDKVEGKGLSTNDFTNDEKNKLAGIETGAEVNEIDTITAGSNVTVSKSGKTVTISATGSGGTAVVANPTLTGSEANLTALQVGATKYGIKTLKVTIW